MPRFIKDQTAPIAVPTIQNPAIQYSLGLQDRALNGDASDTARLIGMTQQSIGNDRREQQLAQREQDLTARQQIAQQRQDSLEDWRQGKLDLDTVKAAMRGDRDAQRSIIDQVRAAETHRANTAREGLTQRGQDLNSTDRNRGMDIREKQVGNQYDLGQQRINQGQQKIDWGQMTYTQKREAMDQQAQTLVDQYGYDPEMVAGLSPQQLMKLHDQESRSNREEHLQTDRTERRNQFATTQANKPIEQALNALIHGNREAQTNAARAAGYEIDPPKIVNGKYDPADMSRFDYQIGMIIDELTQDRRQPKSSAAPEVDPDPLGILK